MEIHILDIVVYFIISFIIWTTGGEGLESLRSLFWWVIFTVVYVIVFGFCDVDITDFLPHTISFEL